MPEIVFKGKEYVYNHHLTVPFRPLLTHVQKGVGAPDLGGNLVIHGDNLHALKSLLPRYAGKVDLVFIDPPYNTGNEGWCYSDGVNSPIMKEWLSTNPVDAEDMLRHDKWLCMMWPRLVLLRELLSERGSIWITLDDNEVHRARMVLDEVFGEINFVANVVWQKRYTRSNNTDDFTSVVDHLLIYSKSDSFQVNLTERGDEADARFTNPDGDKRGPWKATPFLNQVAPDRRPNLCYPITNPNTGKTVLPTKKAWRNDKAAFDKLASEDRLWWGVNGDRDVPDVKSFLFEVKQGLTPINLWEHSFAGHTDEANEELKQLFGEKIFDTPKPTKLVQRVIEHATAPDSLVLDSFAGSGTTAHAVLKANAADGGSRRFILVEGEDYADRLTAERVRRAMKGYAWVGTQKETLLEEKITFTQFRKADEWLGRVEAIKVREGFADGDLADQCVAKAKRFDRISVKLDDGVLRVEGEKKISERVEGLGGAFTYCTLGEPLDLEKLLSGESLPGWSALGEWLFHTATGGTLPPAPKKAPKWYLGEARDAHVWLVYEPSLAFLTRPEAALTLSLAKSIHDWGLQYDAKRGERKRHLVFAPAKYLSNRQLAEHAIDYAPLPFALYREG